MPPPARYGRFMPVSDDDLPEELQEREVEDGDAERPTRAEELDLPPEDENEVDDDEGSDTDLSAWEETPH
jgi:hypothetical protein